MPRFAIAAGLLVVTAWQITRAWNQLWEQVEQELANSEIVVTVEPENQVYTTPNEEQRGIEHTGSVPPQVETDVPGFDTEAVREAVEGQQNTGGQFQQEVDWSNYVMESSNKKPWRGEPVLNDGSLKGGWIHIEARHIKGTHPSAKPADMFEPNTTRAEVEELAREIVKKGVRISKPDQPKQIFELKTKFQGRRERFKAVVYTRTSELITVFPVRSE